MVGIVGMREDLETELPDTAQRFGWMLTRWPPECRDWALSAPEAESIGLRSAVPQCAAGEAFYMCKVKLFIGSSKASLKAGKAIKRWLESEGCAEVHLWDEGVFNLASIG